MSNTSRLRPSALREPFVCFRCVLKASKPQRRNITRRWLAKTADAKKEWDEQAKSIRAGDRKSMLEILEERGLVHQTAG